MQKSVEVIISQLADNWSLPKKKLLLLYALYQKTAVDAGTMSALAKAMGFLLHKQRISAMVALVSRKLLEERDPLLRGKK